MVARGAAVCAHAGTAPAHISATTQIIRRKSKAIGRFPEWNSDAQLALSASNAARLIVFSLAASLGRKFLSAISISPSGT
jgi:hypothetical protein